MQLDLVTMNYIRYALLAPQTWIMFLLGAFIGSFLNVCIFRIPENSFFATARSCCRSCGAGIPFYYNVPILGYILLRGKAACCGAKLSVQYPLVEFFTAVMFAALYWKFPFLIEVNGLWSLDHNQVLRYSHAVTFTSLLVVGSVIDLRLMIIPDVITLGMVATTPLIVWLHPDLQWQSALIGVVVGAGILYAIAWGYWLVRREVGLGMGDMKLLAGIGGWLGYQAILPTIFLSSIVGAAFGLSLMLFLRRFDLRIAIPYGPFLALGAMLHMIFGSLLQEWMFLLAH